jgi:hypothetical protein
MAGMPDPCQKQLFCPVIQLLDEGTKVTAPENVVYSTDPRKATALDGLTYFVKGPGYDIVVAEAVAHLLARDVGLRVPDFGIVLPGQDQLPFFASREVPQCLREVDSWILRERVTNSDLLPRLVVFDVWVANKDRNIGNIVGSQVQTGAGTKITLVAIDFEKSIAIRGPYPLATVNTIPPSKFWPSGTLGEIVEGMATPEDFCATIEGVTESQVETAFASVESHFGMPVEWKESTIQVLKGRSEKIRSLIAEVWR